MYRGQAGLHDLKGQQVPLPPNVTRVYIAGGAWVNGGFVTTAPSTAVTVSGRGVISGSAQPFLKDPAGLGPCHYNGSWCWSLVNMDRGEGHVLEGLVLHDPPKSAQRPITQSAARPRFPLQRPLVSGTTSARTPPVSACAAPRCSGPGRTTQTAWSQAPAGGSAIASSNL